MCMIFHLFFVHLFTAWFHKNHPSLIISVQIPIKIPQQYSAQNSHYAPGNHHASHF